MIVVKNGDLLDSGCNIICHQVNCQGVMGSGIAKQIRDKWPIVYNRFMADYANYDNILGNVLFVNIGDGQYVANMYSQLDYVPRNVCHTDYKAFDKCCKEIADFANYFSSKPCRIGFPYNIGCGLAGGNWSIVEQILKDNFSGPEYKVEIWRRNI